MRNQMRNMTPAISIIVFFAVFAPPPALASVKKAPLVSRKIYNGAPKNYGYLHLLDFRQYQLLYTHQKVAYIKELRAFVRAQESKALNQNLAMTLGEQFRDLLAQISIETPASAQSTDTTSGKGPDQSNWVDDTSDCHFGKIGPNEASREKKFGARCLIGGNLVCLTPRPNEDKFRCTADNEDFKKVSHDAGCPNDKNPENKYVCQSPMYMRPGGGTLCVAKGTGGGDTTSSHCDKMSAKPEEIVAFLDHDKSGDLRKKYDEMATKLNAYCGNVIGSTHHFDFGDCTALQTRMKAIADPAGVDTKNGGAICDVKSSLYGQKDMEVKLARGENGNYSMVGVQETTEENKWYSTKCDESGKISTVSGGNLHFTVSGDPEISGQPDGTQDPRSTCLARAHSDSGEVETIRFFNSDQVKDRCKIEYQSFKYGTVNPSLTYCGGKPGCYIQIGDNAIFAAQSGAIFVPSHEASQCNRGQPMQPATLVNNSKVTSYSYDDGNGRQEILVNNGLEDNNREKCWARFRKELPVTQVSQPASEGSSSQTPGQQPGQGGAQK